MLINVRVGLGWAVKLNTATPSSGSQPVYRAPERMGGGSYNMQPLTVNITQVVDHEEVFKDATFVNGDSTYEGGKTMGV